MNRSFVRAVGVMVAVAVAGMSHAQTTQAVEWKVSEGGNGHWYAFDLGWKSWDQAYNAATWAGAHLATFSSTQEQAFCVANAPGQYDYWLGGHRAEIHGPFSWITGEPWLYTDWYPNCPDDFTDTDCYRLGEPWLEISIRGPLPYRWNDEGFLCHAGNKSILEWDADCNADGKVDYGQILRGELDDDNTNGIPDVCETSVTGVIPPSVPAQGGATVTIKGANFPENPTVLIGGLPATNVVRLSATRITATSPALLPGMTSIAVNGYTLPDALYIRPECGSDLDQNGSVDAADISIILLDFGPCVSNAAAPAAPAIPERPVETPTPTPARSEAP